jgi:hypothetical protein
MQKINMELGASHFLVLVWTALDTWPILKKHTSHFLIKSQLTSNVLEIFSVSITGFNTIVNMQNDSLRGGPEL